MQAVFSRRHCLLQKMRIRIFNIKLNDRKTTLALAIMCAIWTALIAGVGVLNWMESKDKSTSAVSSPSASVTRDGIVNPGTFSGIGIYARISNVDLLSFTYKVHLQFTPHGSLSDSTTIASRNFVKSPTTLYIGTLAPINFVPNAPMTPIDASFSIADGDSSSYPFGKITL